MFTVHPWNEHPWNAAEILLGGGRLATELRGGRFTRGILVVVQRRSIPVPP